MADLNPVSQDLRVRDQDLGKFAQYVKAWAKPVPIRNAIKIESQVAKLLEALGDSHKAVGHKPVRIARKTASWWNEEGKKKHLEFAES